MSGIVTQGNFPRRLLPGIMEWFGAEYKQYQKLYPEFMDIRQSDKRYEDIVGMAGMGLAVIKNEGQSVTYDDFQQGFASRFIHTIYGKGFVITKEAMDDDQYAPKLAELGAKMMARSMLQTREVICANVLNNGFATTAANSTGADGLSLFNTAHLLAKSSATYQNRPTVDMDLSEVALEQATIDIAGLVDDAGLRIAVRPKKLLIHRNDWHNAKRILGSGLRVDTANNDLNSLKEQNFFPEGFLMNPFLTGPSAWFILTDCPNGLILMERESVQFDADKDFDTSNTKYKATDRYVAYWADPRGVYGSVGA